eukprot:TRINITY_DN1213_c0_g3_i2.p1 TRINITY_DN1213_c0_g3~~TRINITY_DN1213_c0_g3_i2.p1  ORF type:complete len:558 (+),score=201.75 TRINITY_DN1213_c0_g3_i2:66-1739(+)
MGNCGTVEHSHGAAGEPFSDDPRIKELQQEQREYHCSRRAAMLQMETTGSRIAGILFDNALADGLESVASTGASQVMSGMVQKAQQKIDWGGKYKKIGGVMPDVKTGEELTVEFGDSMRRTYFKLDKGFLNSASYGATPIPVLEGRRAQEDAFQTNPVYWRFTTLPPKWSQAKARLARMMGTDDDYIQIMPNANAATNTILKSLPWELGDRILLFSVEYDATLLACDWLGREYGVESVELELVPPMSDDEVVRAVKAKLDAMEKEPGGLPKIANFCHVTSKTAWIFPAKEIVKVCHKKGVSVIVDGAQAAGHLDFTVRDIDADWYVGTVHKWMYSCPGVAFLVAKPQKQATTFPQTVSYFDGQGFDKEFSYYGLQDWSTWLSLIDGLDFVENVCCGWKSVRKYCQTQADAVGRVCHEVWSEKGLRGPSWLADWPAPLQGSGRYGHMPIIPLPWHSSDDATNADAQSVMGSLMFEGVTAFTLVIPVRGSDGKVHMTLGLRCACQIYTCEDDWRNMAAKVADFKGSYGKGEVLGDGLKALMPFLKGSESESGGRQGKKK